MTDSSSSTDPIGGAPTAHWMDELGLAATFLTRLPWPAEIRTPRPLMAASWALPVVGVAVGVIGAIAFAVSERMGLPAAVAATIAVAATAMVTGALHEDGLADLADGFGGGRDATAKRRIMRDSRIGTYGVLTLILAVALKITCLTNLGSDAAGALVVAHGLGRAVIPGLARALPFAADDGLARQAGRPGRSGALWAAGIGAAVAVFVLPAGIGVAAALAAGLCAVGVGAVARRQIGGVTGDVFGAAEQAGEVAVLLVVTAYLAS